MDFENPMVYVWSIAIWVIVLLGLWKWQLGEVPFTLNVFLSIVSLPCIFLVIAWKAEEE